MANFTYPHFWQICQKKMADFQLLFLQIRDILDRDPVFFRSEVDAESPTELRQLNWTCLRNCREVTGRNGTDTCEKNDQDKKVANFPLFGNVQNKNENCNKKKIKHRFLALKSQKLRQTIRIMNSYTSGFLRLMVRTVSGWDALSMGRTDLAPAMSGAAGAVCE
jgi:hypothetical protein